MRNDLQPTGGEPVDEVPAPDLAALLHRAEHGIDARPAERQVLERHRVAGQHAVAIEQPAVGLPGDTCAQEGARYQEVVDGLGGVKSTICTNNFSMALEQLAFEITAPIDTFFLSRDPIVASILVYIDNVLQPNSTWTYNATSNSVKVTPAPMEGSTVRIEYDVVCEMP